MKYTKTDIENLAKEIMTALIEHDCDIDTYIYYNNKRMFHKREWDDNYIKLIDYGIVVEENVNPHDYFEYASYDHILSMSFEGRFYYWMNEFGEVDWFDEILDKYDLYCELGESWNLTVCEETDEDEWEYTFYEQPKERERLYGWKFELGEITDERLVSIYNTWLVSVKKYGVSGPCVIGDGINFTLDGNDYFMSTNYNQSDSVCTVIEITKEKCKEVGATNIWYDCGRMD